MSEEKGFTGEWIVRVEGITGPEDADATHDRIIKAVTGLRGLEHAEVIFDASRWKGGDF